MAFYDLEHFLTCLQIEHHFKKDELSIIKINADIELK